MKRILLIALVAITTTLTFAQTSKKYSLEKFTGINAVAIPNITITKGNSPSVTVTGSKDAVANVRAAVRDNVLTLTYRSTRMVGGNKKVNVAVVMPDFTSLTVSGVCDVTTRSKFSPRGFEATITGTSNIALNLSTNKLRMTMGGVNKVSLSGFAKNMELTLSGTSKFEAGNLVAKTADITVGGVGSTTVNVSDKLNVVASGTSTIYYKGSPKVTKQCGGKSKVKKIR